MDSLGNTCPQALLIYILLVFIIVSIILFFGTSLSTFLISLPVNKESPQRYLECKQDRSQDSNRFASKESTFLINTYQRSPQRFPLMVDQRLPVPLSIDLRKLNEGIQTERLRTVNPAQWFIRDISSTKDKGIEDYLRNYRMEEIARKRKTVKI